MNSKRWSHLTEWPLVVASVLFLIAYAWQVIGNLTGPANTFAEGVIWVTWAIFVVDYIVRLTLAERGHRWRWFYTHLFDFLVVVLPILRPLRVLRLVTLLSVLERTAGNAIRGRIVLYVTAASTLLVFIASLAVLDAERQAPDATILTFGDALWWAFVTITTVGYGDFAPLTFEGRLIAVGLMLGGIALLGVVTATIASWIVEKVAKQDAATQSVTVAHVRVLEAKVDELRELILELR